MTNADRIRNMSNEELALLMDDSVDFFNCSVCSHIPDNHCRDDCFPYIKKWLESEGRLKMVMR